MASEVIERSLYNGLYQMVHNPNARGSQPRYKVVEFTNPTETLKPKGVTTILGATLAKDLMQWSADMACEYLRAKLPTVTEEDLKEASKAYTVKRDSGASTGTEAHLLVENFLKDIKGNEAFVASPEAMNAFGAFLEWFKKANPTVVKVEEVIYSHEYKFAGTYDCMLRIDGKVYLCDLKTTNASRKAPNGVYAENFIQLGAYALAHEEQRKYEEANGGTKLVKIEGLMIISAKKDGKLDVVTNDDVSLRLKDCMDMFKKVINVYGFMSYATKELGGK